MPERVVVSAWKKLATGGWAKASEIDTWTAYSVEPRFNQPGPWSVTIPVGAQVFELTKGHLLTFDIRGTRFTGTIETFDLGADDETGKPLLTPAGLDVMSWLGDALGWPAPDQPIEDQTGVRWYATGPAEDVLCDLIQANLVDRLGYDLAVTPSAGRGEIVDVSSTFTNVLEVVRKTLADAALGIRMGLVNTTSNTKAALTVEFYEPTDRANRIRLSAPLNALATWKQSDPIPTATRAIVQGAKEKEGREVDSVNVADDTITTVGKRKTVYSRDIQSVNVAANTITTKKPHKLGRGDRVAFSGAGNPPGPLDDSTDYYAIRVDADTFKAAATRKDATNGNAIGLNNDGSGDVAVDRIKVTSQDNKLRTGEIITFTGGTPPAPLELDTGYHAIRVDEETFKVAYTRWLAKEGEAIELTDNGTGTITVTEETVRYRMVNQEVAEAEWGRLRETFVSGAGDDNNAALDKAGMDNLDGAVAQAGFELTTTEAEGMRYGDHYGIGDLVTVEPVAGAPRVEHVGGVRVVGDTSGIVVTVLPGNPDATNPVFRYAAMLRGLQRRVNQPQED